MHRPLDATRITALGLLLTLSLGLALPTPALAEEPEAAWPTYTLEALRLEGNDHTADALILQAANLQPGIHLEEQHLDLARDRIFSLGLFRAVAFRLEKGSAPGQVILVVRVEERPSLMITDFFLGWTEVGRLYGGGGIADTNFLGRNLIGGLAGVVGGDDRRALRLDLRSPSLFDTRTLGDLRLLYLQGPEVHCAAFLGNCSAEELDRVRYRRVGGRVLLGRPAGKRLHLFLAYRLESVHTDRVFGTLKVGVEEWDEPFLPALPPGDTFLSVLSAALELDTRDDPFIATRGVRLRLTAEVSSPFLFSDYDYSRFRIDAAWHRRAFADHTLRLHAFVGLVQGEAPFFERFHVADHSYFTVGENTVPRALGVSFTEVFQYDPIMMTLGIDYQVPFLRRHHGGKFFYRSYFYAALQVTLSSEDPAVSVFDLSRDPDNEISRFPLSGDLGLRVDTAIGVFSLGLAYPFDLVF
ncbi:MAG: BamA/TamA family outer membrane protein [Deltaproteobacteria bacterium]|nr:BamA/TamA family outer membrane protein [Deltaproteobacteria bacterium]